MKSQPVYFWTVADVQHWLKKILPDLFDKYADFFVNHEITGRVLVTLTDSTLSSMGVSDQYDRRVLLHHFVRLKLATDGDELQEMLDNNDYIHF